MSPTSKSLTADNALEMGMATLPDAPLHTVLDAEILKPESKLGVGNSFLERSNSGLSSLPVLGSVPADTLDIVVHSPSFDLPVLPEKAQLAANSERASITSSLRRRHLATLKTVPPRFGRWIRVQWFMTTYRAWNMIYLVSATVSDAPSFCLTLTGKFFLFVVTFNLVGMILSATGHFSYARTHTGAILLGNLLTAVLMRNELFLRVLYFLTNHLLAKVSIDFLLLPFGTPSSSRT